MRPYLIADLFCGAGGSSTGAIKAVKELNREITLCCVNHWPVAIATHKLNHPEARHYVEDIEKADPFKIVPEGYLDLLMASPECRYFSRARGDKAINDQQRSTAWKVLDWLTKLDVRCVLIENVPEFTDWGPLDVKTNRPIQNKKGLFFQAFVKTLRGIGYRHVEWHFLNAADYGDATTRTRFFLIARKDRKAIRWPEPSHSATGETDMFGTHPKWRAAREIIEWNKPGRSLLDDPRYLKRPLSPKTLQRIAKGLEKFGGQLAPLYIQLLGLHSETTPAGECTAFVMGKQSKPSIRSADEPIQTLTTRAMPILVNPEAIPFVMGKNGHSPAYRSADEPIPTVTCGGKSVLIEPIAKSFLVNNRLGANDDLESYSRVRDIDRPVQTITSHGAGSICTPVMIKYYGGDDISSIDAPVPTVTTKDRFGLVQPFILEVNHDGNRKPTGTDEPLKTVTGKRGTAIVQPYIINRNGENGYDRTHDVNKPIPTATGRGAGYLVEPVLEAVQGGKLDPRRIVLIDGQPFLLDIRFRMLENLELARAMGFTDTESTYEFTGNKSEVTKQIGNAVPVNMAKALVKAILER